MTKKLRCFMHSGVSEDWALAQKSYLRARKMAQWGLEPTFKPGDLPPASCPHVHARTHKSSKLREQSSFSVP